MVTPTRDSLRFDHMGPMSECMNEGSAEPVRSKAASVPPAAVSAEPADAMNGETLQRRVTVVNPQGFHMRPQSLFVQVASQFASRVTVCRNEQRVNGKSQWELMLLAAEPGTELLLEVSGPDALAALEALARVLAAPQPPEPSKLSRGPADPELLR